MTASARTRSCTERNRLVLDHVDVARRIALRVARRVPDDIRQDDLVCAAMLGLTEAAERFDTSQGRPFVAFAEKRIRGAVLDELRRGDLMSRRARSQSRTVGKTIAALEVTLGCAPEDAEVAAELGVSLETYHRDLESLTHVGCVPLDDVIAASTRGPDDIQASVSHSQLTKRLAAALLGLIARDALVLNLYYVDELSYAEIGRLLGVTESRVCQLHGRALARLRVALGEDEV